MLKAMGLPKPELRRNLSQRPAQTPNSEAQVVKNNIDLCEPIAAFALHVSLASWSDKA